jgi:phosphoribosylformimino-5-aminoimidazole carboxamide ribonucleotide (ProFAR) isomerase
VELYPAVDIQGGCVARAPAPMNADPLAVITRFADAGARWVHFVDLDRAYDRGDNRALAKTLFEKTTVPLQVGGGLRTEEAIAEMIGWGAARVVIGTKGALDAGLVDRLLVRHGPARHLARRVRAQGIRTVIYADVTRDGKLEGPDLEGGRPLVHLDVQVIASGGVASLDDLRAVRSAGYGGAIVGRALYEGRFTLEEALACVS